MTTTNQGRFVWHTLNTTDLTASRKFYTSLFGWTATEMDMGPGGKYTMFRAGDKDVAGAAGVDSKGPAASHWLPYPTVDSVDGAADRIPALGGTIVVPPTDIPHVGRFCIALDPQGALVAPFKGAAGAPQRDDSPPTLGSFCWNELLTTDTVAATKFYEKVLGWTSKTMPMGPGATYTMFERGDKDAAGLKALDAGAGHGPQWLPYVLVKDVDATTAKARSLGAKVTMEPQDWGPGRASVLVDPTGARFALWVLKAA